MKGKGSAFGSVIAAALASSCCWVPLLLAAAGAGGAGFASVLAPYRPFFVGVTLLFVAGAWYFTLRKSPAVTAASPAGAVAPGGACCVQEACCLPSAQRQRNILLLVGVTAFALVMLAFPWLSAALAGDRSPAPAAAARASAVETITLRIEGMTCKACEGHIRVALLKVPGVVAADVDYQTASARVTFQRGKATTGQLRQAVAKTGYRVH